MSALLDLSERLSSSTLSSQKIRDGLRVLGFRASVIGVRNVLVVSDELNSQFQQLELIFPNAKGILRDFQLSKGILVALDCAPDPATVSQIRSRQIAAPFCAVFARKDFQSVDFKQYPLLAEFISFFWVVHACLHAQPNIVVSDKLAYLLSASIDYAQTLLFVVEDFPDVITQRSVSLSDGINEWIGSSSEIFWKTISHSPMGNGREEFEEACALIKQLDQPHHATNGRPFEDGVIDDDLSSLSTQKGAALKERERLSIHHNAFQEIEIWELTSGIRSIIENIKPDHYKKTIGATPPYFIEACIVALALSTGRTIRAAIEFSLDSGSAEHIVFEDFYGFNGKYSYPLWIRAISQNEKLVLPLPEFLQCLRNPSIRFDGASTIEDCLPYSIVSWEERCFEWIEIQLPVSRHKLNRKIRDALSRAIYQTSANSALLKWITTTVGAGSRDMESLSHYINPFSNRTIESYSQACTKIFHKYGAPKVIRDSYVRETWAIEAVEHRLISQLFIDELGLAERADDYIRYHNAISRYISMLLVVAAGHRKSKTPFFFPWDILANERLVYISDKQAVGSEARFVPIPKWLIDLVKDYRRHLRDLSEKIYSASPQLAILIEQLLTDISNISAAREVSSNNSLSLAQIDFGHFFTIDNNLKAKTISTRDLEQFYSKVSSKGIRSFRKSVANSLWSQGLSGHQVEAFLGHNGELHSFGESSAWSILEWADPIRKAQEFYLANNGWVGVRINAMSNSEGAGSVPIPSFSMSNFSYEGRGLANSAALANARRIIRDLLPSDWFIAENSKITDDDVLLLKQTALDRLTLDSTSCEKINQAIAKEVEGIRKATGVKIASTIGNLTRTDPGPVGIACSRHFAIAVEVRKWWIAKLGFYSAESNDNHIDRLAAIGISLIVFDAVLDNFTWNIILETIANHKACAVDGCLIARGRVNRSSRIFDKSLILSPYTSAQVVGLERKHHTTKPDAKILKDIAKRIERLLKSAPHASENLTITQLITVFKAWWLLRLPGSQYSIAVGDHSGPAPDILSECALYGFPCQDTYASSLKSDIGEILAQANVAPNIAREKISKLLSHAAGQFELKEQTSRSQRNLLLRLLHEDKEHAKLKAIANQQPIVLIMLEFLEHMIEDGGIRVDVYRFGSIRTYFSGVVGLIESFWDQNINDLESQDFDIAYSVLLNNSDQKQLPISLFHKFLQESYAAPYSSVAASRQRAAIQCRSALITVDQFSGAWTEISKQKDDGQLVSHTKSFLSLGYQYGLRPRESLGLSRSHILTPRPFGIRVEKNNVRDLKTKKSSLRITNSLLANGNYQRHLAGVVTRCQHSPVKNESIFADTEKKDALYSKSRINLTATAALRAATGNLSIVPYSMRHSAATRLAHFAFRSPRLTPLSQKVENALKDNLDSESISACFDGGFHAWPFWLDRVGMFLGHTGADTLLNTYWHTSHVRLAEHTWYASENVQFSQQQLAEMLGRDRISINRQIRRLALPDDYAIGSVQEALILHYIKKSNIPKIDRDFTAGRSNLGKANSFVDTVVPDTTDQWVLFDRLLRTRYVNKLSFEEMYELSAQFLLPKLEARAFIYAYKAIILQTGFDDFEPSNSELLVVPSKYNSAATRGAKERERGLTAAHRLSTQSDFFGENLKRFTDIWIERTDVGSPWFVARTHDELALIFDVLTAIGVTRSQFELAYFNFDLSTLNKVASKTELSGAIGKSRRLSKGFSGARVSECAVRVIQTKDSKIGDHRDTQRLVLVLAAIAQAKYLMASGTTTSF